MNSRNRPFNIHIIADKKFYAVHFHEFYDHHSWMPTISPVQTNQHLISDLKTKQRNSVKVYDKAIIFLSNKFKHFPNPSFNFLNAPKPKITNRCDDKIGNKSNDIIFSSVIMLINKWFPP